MTQEEKQLLLKDLCARLPYKVILHITYYDIQNDDKLKNRDIELGTGNIGYCFGNSHWLDIKPYLRPMSSMTEEEYQEFGYDVLRYTPREFDWLNAHHFDYRGLIEMGLALEAPVDMYKID